MRPSYESSSDRLNELEIITKFCEDQKMRFQKMKRSLVLDYALFELEGKKVAAVAEVKCRDNVFEHYPDIMVGVEKLFAARRFLNEHVPQAILVFDFTDKMMCHIIDPHYHYPIRWGGRWDRGDSEDAEPVFHIGRSLWFEILRHSS